MVGGNKKSTSAGKWLTFRRISYFSFQKAIACPPGVQWAAQSRDERADAGTSGTIEVVIRHKKSAGVACA
jgi:hypothetical protein